MDSEDIQCDAVTKSSQILDSQKEPHIPPSWVSYGVAFTSLKSDLCSAGVITVQYVIS